MHYKKGGRVKVTESGRCDRQGMLTLKYGKLGLNNKSLVLLILNLIFIVKIAQN